MSLNEHNGLGRERLVAVSEAFFGLRRPTRSSIEFAAKAGVATALAIWVGDRIGLQDSYWAGISAVVATAATLGASVGAALSRISATVVGLLIGLAALALPVSGTLVSGATVFVALVVLPALSLDAGARLGAATTLIVTAIPGNNAVSDALARGANVPLGCAVAVAVGVILLPHRAAKRLRADLRADVERAGALARSALLAYLGASTSEDLPHRLEELTRTSSAHATALHDAAREPSERGERLLLLQRQVAAVETLVTHVGSLVGTVMQAVDDTAPSLVGNELQDAAETLAEAARAVAAPSADGGLERSLLHANRALSALDAAFSGARTRRATAALSTDELARLLSVIRSLHAVASALSGLGAGEMTRVGSAGTS